MPTVRKIANPDGTTNDQRRTTKERPVVPPLVADVLPSVVAQQDLPPGWAWTTLGEITRLNERDTALRDLSDSLPVAFVPMAAVDAESGTITTPEERLLAQVRKGFTSFSEGDVLFAKITPCMENGKAAIAKGLTNGRGFGSTEFHVLKPRADILPELIFYFVRQESFRKDAKANFTGTAGQLRVPASFLENFPVPLPPLAEQRRIVEAIEQQFTRLDAGVASLRRAQAELRHYRAAVLKAACEGRLVPQDPGDEPADALLRRILAERRAKWESEQIARMRAQGRMILDDGWRAKYQEPQGPDTAGLPELPKGWVWVMLSQLLREPLRNGHSAKAVQGNLGIRTLILTAVTIGDFSIENTKLTSADPERVKDMWLEPGDILIERSNTPELVGTARLYQGERGYAIFPDLIIRARVSSLISEEFVEVVMLSDRTRRFFRLEAQGIAGSMPKIDQTTVERLSIPLPPLAEQRRIVAEVERRLSVVAEVEAAVAANLKRAERLRQAILKRAFEGKLVPQDPSDEPASALLERIRRKREGQGGKKGVKQERMEGM